MTAEINGIQPTRGNVGSRVVITGEGFGTPGQTNITGVYFGPNAPAEYFGITNDTTLYCIVPDNATTGSIRLTLKDGDDIGSGEDFEVVRIPEITGFQPTRGVPGTLLRIEGKNFTGTMTVRIGPIQCLPRTIQGDNIINTVVPANCPLEGLVYIQNADGTGESEMMFMRNQG